MSEPRLTVKAPLVSFLSNEEAEWVRFVNLRDSWAQEDQADYLAATDQIVTLLHRFLDALALGADERERAFEEIAEEVSGRLRGVDQSLVPNPHFSPGADPTDQARTIACKPFLFANIEGVAGMYASLGRFLSSPYARRLGRCATCRGLYLAPDDSPFTCCSPRIT